jgi:uncharacterized protein
MNKDFQAAKGVQKRSVVAELRAETDFSLAGYAARYNVLSHNLGGFREKLLPGTFSRSIRAGADVKALFNHDPSNILGRTKSGTLKLEEDERGLHFRCQLDKNSQYHRDLYASCFRGDLDECSFAFQCDDDDDDWTDGTDPETGDKCSFRTIKNVRLIDVSVCTYPAYPNTNVGARNLRSLPNYGTKIVTPSDAEWREHVNRKLAAIYARVPQ